MERNAMLTRIFSSFLPSWRDSLRHGLILLDLVHLKVARGLGQARKIATAATYPDHLGPDLLASWILLLHILRVHAPKHHHRLSKLTNLDNFPFSPFPQKVQSQRFVQWNLVMIS